MKNGVKCDTQTDNGIFHGYGVLDRGNGNIYKSYFESGYESLHGVKVTRKGREEDFIKVNI